jgi:hypothetical protein
MTEQQKEILTAKMLDAPASLSDEELALIGNDPELRDIYEMSASIATASAARTRFDMADEWARFSPRIAGPRLKMRWIMKVAAALLGVIVASGIAVTLTDSAPTPSAPQPLARLELQLPPPSATMPAPLTKAAPEDNGDSSTAAANALAAPQPEPALDIDIDIDIDIDEYLRIQQASIDNDLAMLTAGMIADEYEALARIYDMISESGNNPIESAIRKVTMQ